MVQEIKYFKIIILCIWGGEAGINNTRTGLEPIVDLGEKSQAH